MINRTKVKESTQIKPGDNGDVLVMKDNAPEWSTPSDADLAKVTETDAKLAEKQDKLTAGDNIKIEDNVISADGKPTPIAIGTVTSGEVPMVSNSGTDTDVVLNFVLPKGDKGDKGDQGLQGPQGPVGAPFQVKKVYDSVEAMNADYSGSDEAVGEFVLIDTGDVQDPDNSKLYVKGPTQYDFVTDLSGAQGIQGPQGTPGTPAGFGNITATVDSTTGTPQVSVQADGPNTAKNISFSFTGLKGEKGDKGEAGTQVNNLAPLVVDEADAPTVANNYAVAIGRGAKITATTIGGIAIGQDAESATGIAIGRSSQASNGVSVGAVARTANNGTAVGGSARASGDDATAMGQSSEASGRYSVAIGYVSEASGTKSLNINSGGTLSEGHGATGNYTIAIGSDCGATGNYAIAVGQNAEATADGSMAIGTSRYNETSATVNDAISIGSGTTSASQNGIAIGYYAELPEGANESVALGSYSSATEPNVVSVGSGDAAMALTDDMDKETKARIQARAAAATRRIVNVTDPQNAQDAATKNYVDTQLEPINAKLQYVPENTNQILSQIQTNVEKAQAAADAKVASITAGTGISVDASNPTAPVVSTTGLATQASVDALQATVAQLQQTVTQLQSTIANLTLETERI